jgi:CheY-like chemotaxis protein/anti-sigma regulatory factor (Ser/Thr protein kinase)
MPSVLIAEDSATQAQQLQFLLEDAGYQVEVAANGQEALRAIERRAPDLVVTDLEMPEMNGLQLVETIRKDFPAVPVILMTAFGSEEVAALALQKGAASYVPKRYLAQDIVSTVADVLSVSQAAREQQRVLEVLTQIDYQFVLNNDASLIPPLINYLEETLTGMRLCDQTGLIRVCVALREALVNAMDHGNLEVHSSLREQDDRHYAEKVAERRRQEPYRNRRVYVTVRVSPMKAEFVIRDEGPGFDPSRLPDPTDPANLEKVSGRGLLLIRTFMDHVHHNEAGNEITMVKRCDYRA